MESLKNLLEGNYGIQVIDCEKIKNVYKVKTKDGYKCFKYSKYNEGQFSFIISALEHLRMEGFDRILEPNETLDGNKYVKFQEGFGYMCDWIDSREANFRNPVELKLCLETLAKLHISSRGFTYPEKLKGRSIYGKWAKRFQKRCDELLYFKALIADKDKPTEFDYVYLKYFDIHYRQALKAIKDLQESKYLEIMQKHKRLSGFCHHDTANHNFLITGDCSIYMIDFDYCIYDSHLHDLASIIIRNLKYGNWNLEVVDFILEVYGEIIPISREEIEIIMCFMEFPQDFWQVGLQYYVEKQPWAEEFFIRKLGRITADSKERMEFLEEFKTGLSEVSHV